MKARKFTRYPTDIPFTLGIEGMVGTHQYYLKNAGQGGLSFNALGCINQGTQLHISFPLSKELHDANAKIAWCTPLVNGYCSLGIVFDESVTLTAIEQVALTH